MVQQTDRCSKSMIQTLEKGEVILVFLLLPLKIFHASFWLMVSVRTHRLHYKEVFHT